MVVSLPRLASGRRAVLCLLTALAAIFLMVGYARYLQASGKPGPGLAAGAAGVVLPAVLAARAARASWSSCRRPHRTSDYEHSTPFAKGGRTCLCDGGPVCRHHRDKQAPGWHRQPGHARGWFT